MFLSSHSQILSSSQIYLQILAFIEKCVGHSPAHAGDMGVEMHLSLGRFIQLSLLLEEFYVTSKFFSPERGVLVQVTLTAVIKVLLSKLNIS